MEKFVLYVNCKGSALASDIEKEHEIARILRQAAKRVLDGEGGFFETILDINGNDVGRFKFLHEGDLPFTLKGE